MGPSVPTKQHSPSRVQTWGNTRLPAFHLPNLHPSVRPSYHHTLAMLPLCSSIVADASLIIGNWVTHTHKEPSDPKICPDSFDRKTNISSVERRISQVWDKRDLTEDKSLLSVYQTTVLQIPPSGQALNHLTFSILQICNFLNEYLRTCFWYWFLMVSSHTRAMARPEYFRLYLCKPSFFLVIDNSFWLEGGWRADWTQMNHST